MKLIFRLLRNLLVFIGWTIFFIYLSDLFFIVVWNFNFMSPDSWKVLSNFWHHGGIIKSTPDVIFLSAFVSLPILWLIGLFISLRIHYSNIFLIPIKIFYYILDRTSESEDRIIIRNIKSSDERAEEIRAEINSIKPSKNKKASDIRSSVKEKMSNDL